MIDIDHETLIDPRAAARLDVFANQITGKPAHKSKVFRAILQGCRAHDGRRVKLEHVRVPGGIRTSREAIARFVAALTGDVDTATNAAPTRTPARRAREIKAAERELTAAGIL